VVGSLVSGALLESRDLTDIYPLAFLPWAAGIFAAAISQNIWVAALAMVVAGFGNGLTFPMTVLIVQRYTADRLRGRAFTLIISAHNMLLGIAMIAAGALTEVAGARWTYVVAAALLGAGGFAALVLSRGITAEAEVARQQAA
jgi:MFS family permease